MKRPRSTHNLAFGAATSTAISGQTACLTFYCLWKKDAQCAYLPDLWNNALMNTPAEQVVGRIGRLIDKGDAVLRTHKPNPPNMFGFPTLDNNAFSEWRAHSLHMLRTIAGEGSIYATDFETKVEQGVRASVNAGIGILRALREDVEGGHLASVINLIRAELFSDMLEMAEHLRSVGYKDPAASLSGAVLRLA